MFLKSKRNKTITYKYMSSRRQHPFIIIAVLSIFLSTLTLKGLSQQADPASPRPVEISVACTGEISGGAAGEQLGVSAIYRKRGTGTR